MQILHVALWTQNLEGMKYFYSKFFGGKINPLYFNRKKEFESYFITFANSAVSIELMSKTSVRKRVKGPVIGIAHIAFKAGSMLDVRNFTQALKNQGVPVIKEPRITGDGYFESVVADPDGNEIEIVADAAEPKPKKQK